MKKKKNINVHENTKKQNYINRVDFLQYYKKQLNTLDFTLLAEH